jgi:hypothetical protein
MSLISPTEILEIYSYLKHLQIKIKDSEEKKNLRNLLERLKEILTHESYDSHEIEKNSSIIVKNMKAKVEESVLYDDTGKKLKEVLVTILQNFDNNVFEIIIDDLSGKEPFEVSVEELDLNLEERIIRCSQEDDGDFFDIFLDESYVENLMNILNANCDILRED